jgi:hypothetical protein
MNPLLALAMVAAGGLLLAAGLIVYVFGWASTTVAIAVAAIGLLVDTAGAVLLVPSRRPERKRRDA